MLFASKKIGTCHFLEIYGGQKLNASRFEIMGEINDIALEILKTNELSIEYEYSKNRKAIFLKLRLNLLHCFLQKILILHFYYQDHVSKTFHNVEYSNKFYNDLLFNQSTFDLSLVKRENFPAFFEKISNWKSQQKSFFFNSFKPQNITGKKDSNNSRTQFILKNHWIYQEGVWAFWETLVRKRKTINHEKINNEIYEIAELKNKNISIFLDLFFLYLNQSIKFSDFNCFGKKKIISLYKRMRFNDREGYISLYLSKIFSGMNENFLVSYKTKQMISRKMHSNLDIYFIKKN